MSRPWEEMAMAQTNKHQHNESYAARRGLYASLVWIAALMASYFILTDWHSLPALLAATVHAIH